MSGAESTHSIALLPSPDLLASYASVNPDIPAIALRLRQQELIQEYRYAMAALAGGVLVTLALILGFIYLVMQSHAAAATGLLGTGLLGLAGAFVRARLRRGEAVSSPPIKESAEIASAPRP